MKNIHRTANHKGPVILCLKEMTYAFPFGTGYIAGYLMARGIEVQIKFWPLNPKHYKKFAMELIAEKPVCVGFGSLFPDLYPIRELVNELNNGGRNFPVIIGGQMVSPTPEMALAKTGADIGVIGEGEITTYKLIEAFKEDGDISSVSGIIIKQTNEFIATGPGEYIADLSKLPVIPYEIFPLDSWFRIGKYYTQHYQQPHWRYQDRVVSIHGGRGCPFTCNFCYHHSRTRYRKIEDMVQEADCMTSKYNANMVYFGDDLVLATPKRANELVEFFLQIKRPLEYSVSCRFDILDRISDELLKEMKRSGCRIMGLGIESGDQRILDIINKKIKVDQIRRGLSRLKRVGILPTVSIMIGQVSETREEAESSIRLMKESVKENKNIQYAFTIATPFPGSSMFNYCIDNNLLEDEYDFYQRFSPDLTFSGLTVNASAMSDQTILDLYQRINNEYRQGKAKAAGKIVPIIETMRGRLAKLDQTYRSNHSSSWIYSKTYDTSQVALDKIRLTLLGL